LKVKENFQIVQIPPDSDDANKPQRFEKKRFETDRKKLDATRVKQASKPTKVSIQKLTESA